MLVTMYTGTPGTTGSVASHVNATQYGSLMSLILEECKLDAAVLLNYLTMASHGGRMYPIWN